MLPSYRCAARICAFSGALLILAAGCARADEAQDVNKMINANQLDQAMQRVDATLTQKPKDAQMRFFKGVILTQEGKNTDAISVFLHLTQDYPELPEHYNNLAVLYAAQGDYQKARAALEMAVRTHPGYATAQENLGDIYAELASQSYQRAIQLDANDGVAKKKLAAIQTVLSNESLNSKKPLVQPGAKPTHTPAISAVMPSSSVAAHAAASTSEQSPHVRGGT